MQVAVVVSKQEVGDFNALAHVFVHFGLGILQIGTTSFIFSTKKSTLINDSKTAQTKSKQCWKTEEHMWKIKITHACRNLKKDFFAYYSETLIFYSHL